MMNKKWSKEELNQLYSVEGKTLQEIGSLSGVSGERVRQVMEELGLARGFNHSRGVSMGRPRYKSLEDYFRNPQRRKDISGTALSRFKRGLCCAECGGTKSLHIHHIVYPAVTLRDIQVLCASCHYTKHKSGLTYAEQIDMYNQYLGGEATKSLARKYKISRSLIYRLFRKIRSGYGSLLGGERLDRLCRV